MFGWTGILLVTGLSAVGFRLGTSLPNATALDPLLLAGMGFVLGVLITAALLADPVS